MKIDDFIKEETREEIRKQNDRIAVGTYPRRQGKTMELERIIEERLKGEVEPPIYISPDYVDSIIVREMPKWQK